MFDVIVHQVGQERDPRRIDIDRLPIVIGRDPKASILLDANTVSRRHAQIVCEEGQYFIEDLGSRNGLTVNSIKVVAKSALKLGDSIRIGEFVLRLAEPSLQTTLADRGHVIQAKVSASFDNAALFAAQAAPFRLQAVLELSRQLSSSLEPQTLFDKLLEHLLVLFPRADRGTVILCEGDDLLVTSQRSRYGDPAADFPISRSIIRTALEGGVGVLSQDVLSDQRFVHSSSLQELQWRSVLCVPLISPTSRKMGAVQLASAVAHAGFEVEDLHLLTTLAMQAAVTLENVTLQAHRLEELELRKELALARNIQQSYLPRNFDVPPGSGYSLYASVSPAREVSGDLYDFFSVKDGRLAFFLGDVSGKGMPAALFMVAVHALARHFAPRSSSPAATLEALNEALVRDNDAGMFVTLLHGLYDPARGEVELCNAGHPLPLLRNAANDVHEIGLPTGALLGFEAGLKLDDTRVVLNPGDTLVAYTDGVTEAPAPETKEMFGLPRLCQVLGGMESASSFEEQAEAIRRAVFAHTGATTLFDDLTVLFLRRAAAK